jgi:hypothetical protein
MVHDFDRPTGLSDPVRGRSISLERRVVVVHNVCSAEPEVSEEEFAFG